MKNTVFKKINISTPIKIAVTAVVILSLVAFANTEYSAESCVDVVVDIENQQDNYYVDKHDIMNLLNNGGEEVLLGKSFKEINLKSVEGRILSSPYIKETEAFKDLKGNLIVKANLRRPVARIIRSGKKDAYISEEGLLLPISEKFNTRVILVSGSGVEKVMNSELTLKQSNPALFELIQYINADEFWRAQIAQIEINEKEEVRLFPQVTKQIVEFGKISDVETKFKKLKIFYKRVLPLKGWNNYSRVSLKYEGQVVAE